jgi:hypothetical protein
MPYPERVVFNSSHTSTFARGGWTPSGDSAYQHDVQQHVLVRRTILAPHVHLIHTRHSSGGTFSTLARSPHSSIQKQPLTPRPAGFRFAALRRPENGKAVVVMAKTLTIFNVIAGAASMAGLYVSFTSSPSTHSTYVLVAIFAVALFLSLYVLAVPGTRIERNVESKMMRYILPARSDEVGIQRGEFSILGAESTAVEFEPFAELPDVEVIAIESSRYDPPSPIRVTPHQAVFRRTGDSYPAHRETFKWQARGRPLRRL